MTISPKNPPNTDALDVIIIAGDRRALPWEKYCAGTLALIRMAYIGGKVNEK
jgi:hypothetical protein